MSFMCFSIASRRICSVFFTGKTAEADRFVVLRSSFLLFSSMGLCPSFPFSSPLVLHLTAVAFQTGTVAWQLHRPIPSGLWDAFHRFTYIEVLYVIMNLSFSYTGKDFAPPDSVLQSTHLRGRGRGIAIEDWGKKVVEQLSLVLVQCYQFSSIDYWGVYILDLLFLADVPVKALPVLFIPCQIQVQLLLGCLRSVSPAFASILFPGYLLLLHAFSSSWFPSLYRRPFLSKSEL